MTIDELLAMIAALQEAGTDEKIIKKMVLSALAEDTGASVEVPAGDGGTGSAVTEEPPADQGAAPVTSQPMAARNPQPAARPAVRPPAAKPAATPQSYAAKPAVSKLQQLAALIGTGVKAALNPQPASYGAKPNTPAVAPQRPAVRPPAAKPAVAPQSYAAKAETTAEDLLEETLFQNNEVSGLHIGQNSDFLRKLLNQNPALYAEAIAGKEGVVYGDGGASPYTGAQPALASTTGPLAERNQFANQINAYRNEQIAAGRPCSYNDAMSVIIQRRGQSR